MKNVWLLFSIAFFSESVAACVAYLYPLTKVYGGNVNTVLLLQLEFIILLALFQLPTGRFADRVSFKASITLGLLTVFCGSLVYVVADHLLVFFLAEAIWAVGASFIQGADISLLEASLIKKGGDANCFQKYRGYLGALRTVSRIGFFCIGGFLVESWLYAPFLLSTGFLGIACVLSLFLKNAKLPAINARAAPRKTSAICVQYLNPQSFTGRVICAQALILSGTYIGFWLSMPWMESLQVGHAEIGVSLALLAGVSAASNLLASNWKIREHSMRPYIFLVLTTVSGFYLLTLGSLTIGLVGLALHKVVFGFTDVIVDRHLLEVASEDEKATITSLSGMVRNACMAFFLLLCIVAESYLDIAGRFGLIGAVMLLAFMLQSRRYLKNSFEMLSSKAKKN